MPTSRFDSRAVFLFLYGCTRLRFAKARQRPRSTALRPGADGHLLVRVRLPFRECDFCDRLRPTDGSDDSRSMGSEVSGPRALVLSLFCLTLCCGGKRCPVRRS